MSSKLVTGDPRCFIAGSSLGINTGGCKIRKRNHAAGQCHPAPSLTPASDHPQPAMPHMISFLFICKTGAVGSPEWSYCWTCEESGSKCHMKPINQGWADVAVECECGCSPGWRLNMLQKVWRVLSLKWKEYLNIAECQAELLCTFDKAHSTVWPHFTISRIAGERS